MFLSYILDHTMPIDGEPTSDDGKKGGAPGYAEMGNHWDFVIFKVQIIPLYFSNGIMKV